MVDRSATFLKLMLELTSFSLQNSSSQTNGVKIAVPAEKLSLHIWNMLKDQLIFIDKYKPQNLKFSK